MAATKVSGKHGRIAINATAVLNVKQFTIDRQVDIEKQAHSHSSGWKEAIAGNANWSGSFQVDADGGAAPQHVEAAVGVSVAAVFTTNTGVAYTGNIMISGSGATVNVEGGEAQRIEYQFEGDGPLTVPTVSQA